MSGSFDQTVCTQDELKQAGFSEFFCYTRKQNVGLVVVCIAGFVSLAAVITMFCLIMRNLLRTREFPVDKRPRLIRVPMDLFMLSLFTGDLFQSLGVVLDVRWINDGIVHIGGICTAQGVLQNIGQAAIAMTTFIITLHTFDSIWRAGGVISLKTASVLVGIMWTFLILTVAISTSVHNNPPFYAPAPYWCWINSGYPNYQIALENFWLWIGFAVSILYVPLLFWDAGRISPGEPEWWTFKVNSGDSLKSGQRFKLIVCALAYCLPVLPTSLARWFLVVHDDVKPFATSEAQFILKGIFSLSGLCDVVACKYARSGLLLCDFNPAVSHTTDKASQDSGPSSPTSLRNMNDTENVEHGYVIHGPLTKHRKLLGLWLTINGFDAVWITYYVRAATNPNPRSAVNRNHTGWEAYYVTMYLFGFFWGCVNIAVCMWYFQTMRSSANILSGSGDIRSRMARRALRGARIFCIFALATISVVLALGPFFSPVIGLKLTWQHAWHHRCDTFPVEIVLTGLSFKSRDTAMPTAAFYLRDNGVLQNQYVYNLTNDVLNTSIWRFVPSDGQPLINVVYNLDNSSLGATCAGNSDQCTQGSFDQSATLSFTLTNSINGTTVKLRAGDEGWDYGKSDDAPSFILKEVQPDGSLGQVVVRTAVTQPGHCASLKFCANGATVETLAPVGLALMKQNAYAKVCTTPNSN